MRETSLKKEIFGPVLVVLAVSLLAVSLLARGCTQRKAAKTLTIAGSTTVLPVAQAAAEEYEKEHPGVEVLVQGGGSSAGIEAAITGTADIGMSSRELKGKEKRAGLTDHIVAIDAIAIIINPQNPVQSLSKEQVKRIFKGETTNWQELGGVDVPLILINRDEGSGTREAFSKKVMGEEDFTKNAVILPGSGQVRSVVGGTSGAIGYISLGYVTKEVRVLEYNGVKPNLAAIKKGEYDLQRKLYFLTKGKATGLAKDFIDFVLSPKIQREIVAEEFIPVR